MHFVFFLFFFPYAVAVHIMNNELWNFSVHLSISVTSFFTSLHCCIIIILFSVKSSEDIGEIFYYMLGTYIRSAHEIISHITRIVMLRDSFPCLFFVRSVFFFFFILWKKGRSRMTVKERIMHTKKKMFRTVENLMRILFAFLFACFFSQNKE